jgi:hypothetical protein
MESYESFVANSDVDLPVLRTKRRFRAEGTVHDIGVSSAAPRRQSLKSVYVRKLVYERYWYMQAQNCFVTVVQALQAAGYSAKVRFCNWFSKAVCGGEVDPLITYLTDAELVSLKDKVNIKNNRYWLADNHK